GPPDVWHDRDMDRVLPRPRVAERAPGVFELTPGSAISGPAALVDAVRLALAVLDLRPVDAAADAAAAVRVIDDAALGPEAYEIEITAEAVRITAADRAGAFYAGQTL